MAEPEKPSDQQPRNGEQKKNDAQPLTSNWAKLQYETYKERAYSAYKKCFEEPWWFQEKEPIARLTGYLTLYTGVLAIVATLQFCALHDTDEKIGRQLLAAHPPKIKIRLMWVNPDGHPGKGWPLRSDGTINVRMHVGNYGRNPGTITNSYAIVHCTDKPLPMLPPYKRTNDGMTVTPSDFIEKRRLDPGQAMFAQFIGFCAAGSDIEAINTGGDPKWSLYVMGWLSYKDDISARHLDFARVYRPSDGRFVSVKDSDYEFEPE